jgi:hypothetical protein
VGGIEMPLLGGDVTEEAVRVGDLDAHLCDAR